MARDLVVNMQREGKSKVLDQFTNPYKPAHPLRDHRARALGPDRLRITHLVSARGRGHHHRRVALPEGEEPFRANHWRKACRGLALPGIRK
jgi:hypothetical protein